MERVGLVHLCIKKYNNIFFFLKTKNITPYLLLAPVFSWFGYIWIVLFHTHTQNDIRREIILKSITCRCKTSYDERSGLSYLCVSKTTTFYNELDLSEVKSVGSGKGQVTKKSRDWLEIETIDWIEKYSQHTCFIIWRWSYNYDVNLARTSEGSKRYTSHKLIWLIRHSSEPCAYNL